jgi:hypothetical protein
MLNAEVNAEGVRVHHSQFTSAFSTQHSALQWTNQMTP